MAQEIISQFRRVFNSPIELYRQVATPTERNNIPSGVRWVGMLVYVVSDGITYSLSGGGVDNGSWELLGGLQDAPSDGQTYGRKDGVWSLMPTQQSYDFSVTLTELTNPSAIVVNDFNISIYNGCGLFSGILEVDNSAVYSNPAASVILNGVPDILGNSWIFGFCELTFANQRYDGRKCRFVNVGNYLLIEQVTVNGTYSSIPWSSWNATESSNSKIKFSIPFKLDL